MILRGPVMAATTLEPECDEAIRQGAAIARSIGAPFLVCHVLPEIYGIHVLFPHLREVDRGQAERVRKAAAAAAQQQLKRVLGDGPLPELHLESGSAHSRVLAVAEERKVGLIVVGFGSAETGASLGGVAERIVRHAHCPVLVAVERRGRCVLAATDFSDPALPAVEAGREEAQRLGLPFVVMHSVDLRVVPVDSPEGSPSLMFTQLLAASQAYAKARLAEIKAKDPKTETVLTEGAADAAILQVAGEMNAELIVLGTHGHSGFRRLALGSTAEQVMRKTPCSAMIVRLSQ
jgi:nucleotide-binding universal stress UspA family protein